jgi:hypothetical protein
VTGAGYATGVALLASSLGSVAVTALTIRQAFLPRWSSAPARLVEAVVGLTLLTMVGELLGTVDAFRRWAFVPALLIVAFVIRLGLSRRARSRDYGGMVAAAATNRASIVVMMAGATFAAAKSAQAALEALRSGMRSFDTLWYHMPFAARFAQEGALTHLQYIGNGPTSFYPANSELVHAIGILLMGGDVLSPVLNIAWLGLALLAAWCIGRPSGVAPATTTAALLVSFLPSMGAAEAGTASTDIAGLALLLAAVAILVNAAPGCTPAALVSALAAGLAIGTRLNLLAPVSALAILAILVTPTGLRRGAAVRWTIGLMVGGAYWYIRNLAEVGNPLPWFGLKIGGLLTLPATTSPADCGRTSVAHYGTDPTFLHKYLVPQLVPALGRLWWIVILLAAVGIVAGIIAPDRRMTRALAIVALTGGAAYLVTPATAGGEHARCFAFNTRFATPTLGLALIVLSLVLARSWLGRTAAPVAFAALLVVTAGASLSLGATLVALVLVVGALAVGALRRVPRGAAGAALVAAAALAALAGWHEQRIYSGRYARLEFTEPIEDVVAALRSVRSTRIAVSGFAENYPFYGQDLSNRVEYPAVRVKARFVPYETCRSWVRALRAGRYAYVVTAQEGSSSNSDAVWTRRYPGAVEVLASAPGTERHGERWTWQLFRIDPRRPVDAAASCARLRS